MKILILYFSMTGRTKRVAETIAEELSSFDLKIEQVKYNKKVKDLLKEQDSIKRGVLTDFSYSEEVIDLEYFDLIFFGTPTYGGLPPPIFEGFLEIAKNVNGKRFILFNTCRFIVGKTFERMQTKIEEKGGIVLNKGKFKGLFKINMKKVKKFIDNLKQELIKS